MTDADAAWLFNALKNSPIKRDVKISHGTHLLHLERNRFALYRETQSFLKGGDQSFDLDASEKSSTTKTNLNQTEIMEKPTTNAIPGYDYAASQIPPSPLTMDDLHKLEEAVGWTEDDAKWMRVAAETLVPKAEQMVDEWRAAIGRQPHLVAPFLKPDGQPDDAYKAAVKRRFVQWVADVCLRPHDQDWLNYQEEIGKRHTLAKKNQTDGAHTPPVVPLRYLIGFTAVVITSVRPFLLSSGRSEEDLQRMQAAWTRAVLLNITLWTRPYTPPELW